MKDNIYFEDIKVFAYKNSNEKLNKKEWRISVDMGLQEFLRYVEKYTNIQLGACEITGGIVKEIRDQNYLLIKEALRVISSLEDTLTIFDKEFEPDNDMIKKFNDALLAVDKATIYNKEYWTDTLNKLESFRVFNVE